MLSDFIQYLTDKIGQPYLWGGQHTRLTPETYETIIHNREDGRGGYKKTLRHGHEVAEK